MPKQIIHNKKYTRTIAGGTPARNVFINYVLGFLLPRYVLGFMALQTSSETASREWVPTHTLVSSNPWTHHGAWVQQAWRLGGGLYGNETVQRKEQQNESEDEGGRVVHRAIIRGRNDEAGSAPIPRHLQHAANSSHRDSQATLIAQH